MFLSNNMEYQDLDNAVCFGREEPFGPNNLMWTVLNVVECGPYCWKVKQFILGFF